MATPENPLVNELDRLSRERLDHPAIKELYEEYVRRGIFRQLSKIIEHIPLDSRAPISHTLATHITKEKPLFLHELGIAWGVKNEEVGILAGSVDLLWTLSLMYDDLTDRDRYRAGKETAWAKYGIRPTYRAAQQGFSTIVEVISTVLDVQSARACQSYVEQGVASLKEQSILTLGCSLESVEINYTKRANFHTTFPVEVLASRSEIDPNTKSAAIAALRNVNVAGQILNDLKDLLSNPESGRKSLGDFRRGTVTFPIAYIWQIASPSQKTRLQEIFGREDITGTQAQWINSLLINKGTLESIKSLVLDRYHESYLQFECAVGKSDMRCFRVWIRYKLGQLEQL